jgi:Cys-tRNA(Pro) deacylase
MDPTPAPQAIAALEFAGIEYRVVPYGPVRTAEEAAIARGIPLEALVKTLVIRLEENSYVLALIPGNSGLDYRKLRSLLGVRRLTMPDPAEAREATGYERGTITPLGAAGEWPTIIDTALTRLNEISLGSGTHGVAIHLSPSDLDRAVTTLTVAEIAK